MLKWLKWFFAKKVKVVMDSNFTESLHTLKRNKALIGKPMVVVVRGIDGFDLDFVRVYIQRNNDTVEIECIKEINNIAIVQYTPTREDKKIIIQSSGRMISPRDTMEQSTVYEIRCDEFQYIMPKHGGQIFIKPYIIKSEYTDEGRIESVIGYNPDEFGIEIISDKIDSGDWVLNGNELFVNNNDGDRIEAEIIISYNSMRESNQIYQD